MSNLMKHAERELAIAGIVGRVADQVLTMVAVFSAEGHSGGSAPYGAANLANEEPDDTVRALFWKVVAFEPINPLTGEEDEWCCVAEQSGYPLWQNARCGRVFKEGDGQAYDIDGKIFEDENGSRWNKGRQSRVPVTFPYLPVTVIESY